MSAQATTAAQAANFRVTAMGFLPQAATLHRCSSRRQAIAPARLAWDANGAKTASPNHKAERGVEYPLQNRGGLAQRHRGAQPRHRHRLPAAGSAAPDL